MSNQKLKDRAAVESNNIIFPVQPSSGTGWLKLTFQKLKDLLFITEIEIPADSIDIYLTNELPIFEVENDTQENLKVHNSSASGTISLYPLDAGKSCNFYFLSDNVDAVIKVYDASSVLLASYPATKNTVFACVFTVETGWNVTLITGGKQISDVYTFNNVTQTAEIKSTTKFRLLCALVPVLETNTPLDLIFLTKAVFSRTKNVVKTQTITSQTFNLNLLSNDYNEIIYSYPATSASQLVITLNDIDLKGRQFLFHVKNNTTQQLTIDITSTIISNISKNVTLSVAPGGGTIFKITVFNNYIISTTV